MIILRRFGPLFCFAITKLKIGRRQFLSRFLVESNKFSQPIAYWPLTSPTSELVVPIFTELPNPVGIFFRVGKSFACHSPAKWCLCAYSVRILLGLRGLG